MTVKLEIPEQDLRKLDTKLAGLGGIHQSKALLDGMKAAGRAVRKRSKELAPRRVSKRKQKTVKTKSGKLVDVVSVREVTAFKVKAFVRENEPILEVRVKGGYRAPHFHLVELGHRIVTGGTVQRIGSDRAAGKSKRTGERGKGKMGSKVAGRLFLSRGAYASRSEQIKMMSEAVQRAIRKISGA